MNEVNSKKYKNKLTQFDTKWPHYENKLTQAKFNMKKTWRIQNDLMNRKSNKANLPSTFKLDSHEIDNPNDIPNQFCKCFANIGPNLTENISVAVTRPFFIFVVIILPLCFLNQSLCKK